MEKRANFHFQPAKGWMNDPNGLIYFKGRYHAFFQYNPDNLWNEKIRWGHAVSDDLLHWEQLPSAIYPDEEYDATGCWSGSALEKDGRLYVFYTSVSEKYGQTQSVAYSDDGINFTKYEKNPVICAPPFDTKDFRDPKVGEYNGRYIMVLGCGVNGEGKILLYESEDLLSWNYSGVLYEKKGMAKVFECPDFFPLGDKYVLMFSKIGQNVRATHFAAGAFDGKKFTPEFESEPEYGPQYFAAQTFPDAKGRRISIAWMSDWTRKPAPDATFMGSFTVPREVELKEGKITLYPVEEARFLLTDTSAPVSINGNEIRVEGKEPVLCPVPIRTVSVLTDGDLVEIFVNRGEFTLSYVL